MVRTESGCVDCGLPCRYNACQHYKCNIYECDNCEKGSKLYWFNGKQLCIDCIEEQLEEVCYDE